MLKELFSKNTKAFTAASEIDEITRKQWGEEKEDVRLLSAVAISNILILAELRANSTNPFLEPEPQRESEPTLDITLHREGMSIKTEGGKVVRNEKSNVLPIASTGNEQEAAIQNDVSVLPYLVEGDFEQNEEERLKALKEEGIIIPELPKHLTGENEQIQLSTGARESEPANKTLEIGGEEKAT